MLLCVSACIDARVHASFLRWCRAATTPTFRCSYARVYSCVLHISGVSIRVPTPRIYYRFPLLFPLRNPTYLPAGCTMEVHLSRNIGNGKVWYEWAVTAPSVGAVNNVNGRSFSIGL